MVVDHWVSIAEADLDTDWNAAASMGREASNDSAAAGKDGTDPFCCGLQGTEGFGSQRKWNNSQRGR